MNPYHKIDSVYLRDPATKHKTFLIGQYARDEFEFLAHLEWVWTEKIDGTNIRVHWDGANVRFGGRSDSAQIPAFLVEHLQDTFTPERMAAAFTGEATLYGEGYGARIQKGGGNYRPDAGFILFDAHCGVWLRRDDVEDVASKLGVPAVPVVGTGTLPAAVISAREGFNSACAQVAGTQAEGLVMRPAVELTDRMGRRIITKVKHRDFQ